MPDDRLPLHAPSRPLSGPSGAPSDADRPGADRSGADRGFTAVELIVVIAVLALLAGVLVPTVNRELERSLRADAMADVHRLAVAVDRYLTDVGRAPDRLRGEPVDFLVTAGDEPDTGLLDLGRSVEVSDLFIQNADAVDGWAGPYLGEPQADPWGRRYLVHVRGFREEGTRVWILCAGENGVIDTLLNESIPGGDDVGMYVR